LCPSAELDELVVDSVVAAVRQLARAAAERVQLVVSTAMAAAAGPAVAHSTEPGAAAISLCETTVAAIETAAKDLWCLQSAGFSKTHAYFSEEFGTR
jgi:hypothetical protein